MNFAHWSSLYGIEISNECSGLLDAGIISKSIRLHARTATSSEIFYTFTHYC